MLTQKRQVRPTPDLLYISDTSGTTLLFSMIVIMTSSDIQMAPLPVDLEYATIVGLTTGSIDHIMTEIQPALREIREAHGHASAVFDLDDTLVCRRTGIPGNIELVRRLEADGVRCVVVTARTSEYHEFTKRLLATLGLGHLSLICMPLARVGSHAAQDALLSREAAEAYFRSITAFKCAARLVVHEKLGTLVLTVGDKAWDHYRCTDVEPDTDRCVLRPARHLEPAFMSVLIPAVSHEDRKRERKRRHAQFRAGESYTPNQSF